MGWWKKKKSRAVVKEQTWDRDQWRGEKILEALIQCCDGKPNPIKFFTADQILKATQKHFCKYKNGVAKLNDLSYCVSIPKGETHVKLTWAGKDYDYMDDDYIFNRVVSEKTDVFGFGVFMQKLLTGEENFEELCGWKNWREKNKFPKWLSTYMGEGRMNEIVDPKMSVVLEEEERCLMEAFLVLSERCIGLRGEVPKMVEVAKELIKEVIKTRGIEKSTRDVGEV
uniref:Serine-threonine/tyrosine-protein kinase catalytic domain-containing protein n=1 Tax=Brassica oleracea var. oleracea TaxID=109376 RepID=A0A0D3AZ02_BRAOL